MIDGDLLMDDDFDDEFDDFGYDFKNYIKSKKLNWRRLKPMDSWVFWSEDAVESDSHPPTHSSCGVPNSVPEALIANGKVIDKIRSVVRKLIIDCECFEFGVLIQLWAPRTDGNRRMLTIVDQPFGLSKIEEALCKFRMMCMNHKFYVDAESADDPGVLGHVFQQNEPAFTPDVRHYTDKEYPQRYDALKYVRTSMAFPVVEPSTRCCVGVLELLTSKATWPNGYLVAQVNEELQDAGLKSSDAYGHAGTSVDDKAHNQVLKEISKGMKVVCETHKLLLGQTWIPCRCCRDVKLGGSCSMCYVSCKGQVMSKTGCEPASYALDEDSRGFVHSCTDHFVRTGHGVGGRALLSHHPCFCKDVTLFGKSDYPLVHLARMYGLVSCFAICLRSTYTGDADYVIEFFLPQNKEGGWFPRTFLYSILATMKQHFQSFRVASGEELGQELSIEVIKVLKDRRPGGSFQICQITMSLQNVGETVQLDSTNHQLMVEADAINNERNVVGPEQNNGHDVIYSENNGSARTSMGEKTETENLISRDVLEQLYGTPLLVAAESLDVSRSTFKRICSKCGINRWPKCKKKEENGPVQGSMGSTRLSDAFSSIPSALAISTGPEEPCGETVIENEGTAHDLRNICPTPTAAESCHQGLDLELNLAATNMASETPLEGVLIENEVCQTVRHLVQMKPIWETRKESGNWRNGGEQLLLEDEELNDEASSLNLKLGGQVYHITEAEKEKSEGKSGKKSNVVAATSNHAVCQVEDCQVDLNNAKNYHRRHKVCEMHSKASRALVGNVMQRFCQQCSRFHVLQEFDEGKRSCRRRLAVCPRRRLTLLSPHKIYELPKCKEKNGMGSPRLSDAFSPIPSSTLHEEPFGETVIENEGTVHDLRNICPTPTAAESCHQGLDLERNLVATNMANELPPCLLDTDHLPKAQPETPLEGMLIENELDSTNQQLMVEADAINNERNVIGPEHNNGHDVIFSENNGSARTSMGEKTETEDLIGRDVLGERCRIRLQALEKCLMELPETPQGVQVVNLVRSRDTECRYTSAGDTEYPFRACLTPAYVGGIKSPGPTTKVIPCLI